MESIYYKEIDGLNVALRAGAVSNTVEVAPEIFLDFDKKGNKLNIDILGASEKIGNSNFDKVFVGKRSINPHVFA